jgi:hypothetical protein
VTVISCLAFVRLRRDGCDEGVGVVDGDGVLVEGDGPKLADVDLTVLGALSSD